MAGSNSAISHVQDHGYFEFFETSGAIYELPYIRVSGYGFQLTKFMVLEVMAALVVIGLFLPLAARVRDGRPPRGAFWNLLEFILTFVRDQVAKPNIGAKDADKYVPFLWTLFLFILVCNLFGLVPFLGSPTGAIMVTGPLALFAFASIHAVPILNKGPKYLADFVPHVEIESLPVKVFVYIAVMPLLFVIELASAFIRAIILAIRLFANMFAGHVVVISFLGFIAGVWDKAAYVKYPITVLTVGLVTALNVLELGVAFLQAYIFVFLTSLFIGLALHPEH